MTLKYYDLNSKLLELHPQLRPRYEEELEIWGEEEPGPHIVFGDILAPYLGKLLMGNTEDDTTRSIFNFLEELASNPDVHVQEVVAFSVIEYLLADDEQTRRASEYMGTRTREILKDVRTFWRKTSI